MHFTKVFALAAFFAGAAIAAPHAEPNVKPPKPSPKPPVTQKNACNNDAQAYCCTVESGGAYGSCYAYQYTNQCSQVAICCNNNYGTQTCIGGAAITNPPYYPYP